MFVQFLEAIIISNLKMWRVYNDVRFENEENCSQLTALILFYLNAFEQTLYLLSNLTVQVEDASFNNLNNLFLKVTNDNFRAYH